jgi:hypothetical protein
MCGLSASELVFFLQQIQESIGRYWIILGDKIPNLHQVLVGERGNPNARHLPVQRRLSTYDPP